MVNSQRNEIDVLPRSASALGCCCEQDKQGTWRIYARHYQKNWHLQQKSGRWLLVVNGVPQILFQSAEAIAFIKRRKSRPQKISGK